MLQNALHQAEEEKKTLKENLSNALSNKDNLSIALETLKKAALDAEKSHSSAILEWESRADRLRADLENMTKASAANESEIENYKVKVDELAFQLVANRKEMNVMLMEIDQLKKENEESSRKMKEILETRIQQQLQHEQNVDGLQKSFLSQLEEHRKGSELQLESMEDKFRRQKEEKARAKEACAGYTKALKEVEQKMEDQESKFLSRYQSYENKVGMNLRETKATCAALEKKMSALMQEHGARTTEYVKEIQLLKQTLSEEECGHRLALVAASQSQASQLQRGWRRSTIALLQNLDGSTSWRLMH